MHLISMQTLQQCSPISCRLGHILYCWFTLEVYCSHLISNLQIAVLFTCKMQYFLLANCNTFEQFIVVPSLRLGSICLVNHDCLSVWGGSVYTLHRLRVWGSLVSPLGYIHSHAVITSMGLEVVSMNIVMWGLGLLPVCSNHPCLTGAGMIMTLWLVSRVAGLPLNNWIAVSPL